MTFSVTVLFALHIFSLSHIIASSLSRFRWVWDFILVVFILHHFVFHHFSFDSLNTLPKKEKNLRFGTYIFIWFCFCSTEKCVSSFKVIFRFKKKEKNPAFYRGVWYCFHVSTACSTEICYEATVYRLEKKKLLSTTECERTNKIDLLLHNLMLAVASWDTSLSLTLTFSLSLSLAKFLLFSSCAGLYSFWYFIPLASAHFFHFSLTFALRFCDSFQKNSARIHAHRDVSNMFSILRTFPSNFFLSHMLTESKVRFRGVFFFCFLAYSFAFFFYIILDMVKKKDDFQQCQPNELWWIFLFTFHHFSRAFIIFNEHF